MSSNASQKIDQAKLEAFLGKVVGDLGAAISTSLAAIGDKLGESLDDLVAPLRAGISDPIARLSFGLTKILEKAIAEPLWARLVIQRAQAATEVHQEIRTNLKADLEEAIAQRRLAVADVEFAADVVIGICIEVARGTLLRRAAPNLPAQALVSVLRALGATPADQYAAHPIPPRR